jgi:hypothetical protein
MAKLGEAAVGFFISIRPHGTTWLSLDFQDMLLDFFKNVEKFSALIKILEE